MKIGKYVEKNFKQQLSKCLIEKLKAIKVFILFVWNTIKKKEQNLCK